MPTLTIPPSTANTPGFSFDLGNTLGALEISILVALFLSRILTVQVWLYFQRFWRDPWGFKPLVGVSWSLDLGHTIAICHTLYTITVLQYGQPQLLIIPPLSLDTALLISGCGWFTYRLYKLTERITLPLICAVLALARFVGTVGLSSIALHQYTLPEYNARAGWLIEAIVIVSACLDTILVLTLCYHLTSWRTEQTRVMRKILNQPITWTIESGALTIVGALGILITFSGLGKCAGLTKYAVIYIGFFVVLPKLFSNSLLLSLNARERFAQLLRANAHSMNGPVSPPTIQLANIPGSPPPAASVEFRNYTSEGSTLGEEVTPLKARKFIGEQRHSYGAKEALSASHGWREHSSLNGSQLY
ncbi:hypothetical protein DFH09DRAFT_1136378 [Mycena vulgaris]|nr:hypothetical protein DFH09DRAFT_1136378 [Mycena vulgaris]